MTAVRKKTGADGIDVADVYRTSDLSLQQLASLYRGRPGCSLRNLEYRCKNENWLNRRAQYQEKRSRVVVERAAALYADLAEKQLEDISNNLGLARAVLSSFASALNQIGVKEFLAFDVDERGRPILTRSDRDNMLNALRVASQVLALCHEQQRLILGPAATRPLSTIPLRLYEDEAPPSPHVLPESSNGGPGEKIA